MPSIGTATDGSGYTLYLSSTSFLLYDRSGNAFQFGNSIKDPDGASISYTSTNGDVYTDTLGATVMTDHILYGHKATDPPDTYTYAGPDGGNEQSSVIYGYQPLQTAFGCPLINELNGLNDGYLPIQITTPAGNYNISYEPTPGHSGFYTGRIAQITLPSGGYVQYGYSGGNNNTGIDCSSQVVPTLTRTVNDNHGNISVWKYVNNNTSATPGNYTVVETDPALDQTVHHFAGEFQTMADYYQGGCPTSITGCNGGGTELRFITTCYNGNFSSCATASVPALPITQTDVYTWMQATPQNLVETIYDCKTVNPCYGLVTSVGRWDWGAPLPPTSFGLISTTYTPRGSWNGRTLCGRWQLHQ